MSSTKSVQLFALASLAVACLFHSVAFGQLSVGTRTLVTQNIDESHLVTLRGNKRSEANAANDRGRVAEEFRLEHLFLQLKRSAEQEQALEQYIDQLHDPQSPNYHKWLAAQNFGQAYGLAKEDLSAITSWLQSHGLKVNVVYPNGTLIDFSGTARQIRETFHTEIHRLVVNGARHVANMSNPKIPEALEPAIVGIASLNDFMPHAMLTPQSDFAISNGRQVVVPEDLATIYNLNPLFKSGISGRGQTIVVIESTDVFNLADWHNFRKVFGLATAYPFASFTQIHPSSGAINNCVPPGTNGADEEAILDAEWSSAAAPNANIVLASCLSTTTFGGLIAVQNLINMPAPPPIMSISYGSSESNLGAAQNAAYYYTYQQAVAEGVSIFVSSGDSGADTSDRTTRHPWNQRKRLCIYAL